MLMARRDRESALICWLSEARFVCWLAHRWLLFRCALGYHVALPTEDNPTKPTCCICGERLWSEAP